MKKSLSIGQVSERTGLAISAIRFYEEKGLITPLRNPSGQRSFLSSDIRRLSFIMIAQKLGFTLEEIKQCLAGLPNKRTPTQEDWSRISRRFREAIQERIEMAIRMRDRIDGCIGCGCLSLSQCQLHNPDDKLSEKGPGPNYLLYDD